MSETFPPAPSMRPRQKGFKGWIAARKFKILTAILKHLLKSWPVVKLGKTVFVTRYDDVRAVLGDDVRFNVRYADQLKIATGEPLFLLGENDPDRLAGDIEALRSVMRPEDVPGLGADAAGRGAALLEKAGGRIELVDAYFRAATFGLFEDYLGIAGNAELRRAATRMYEFVFYDADEQLKAAAPDFAKQIRTATEAAMAAPPEGSVLARCRAAQQDGDKRFTDDFIRSMIGGMYIGGPPQPVIVLAQAMDVLLSRPQALEGAQAAARQGTTEELYGYMLEAMRFQPLAPALLRVAAPGAVVARGTWHEHAVAEGSTVIAGVAAAMFDPRRVAEPDRFDPKRPYNTYLHYGFGAHECFARHLNAQLLPGLLRPLLSQPNLRRAPRKAGKMQVNGPFPETFWVQFD